jgi:hypothetical protein
MVTSRSVLALFEHRNETEVVTAGVGRAAITCGREEWVRYAAEYEEGMPVHERDLEVGMMILQKNNPRLHAATYGQLSQQEAKQ